MGCNTSKDSVPQNESENKENQDTKTEAAENKTPENKTEGDENILNENSDTKSVSAKTITLRSNGTAKSVEEPEGGDNSKVPKAKEATDRPKSPSDSLTDKDQAATKIQAAFRGHKTRESMKQPANKVAQAEAEPTQEQLNEEFRLDDPELCNAATKIQASFRGHLMRKHEAEKKNESSSSQDDKKKVNKENADNNDEEELDIDLADPELNKAAVKIQASFRGHMVRKENETTAN